MSAGKVVVTGAEGVVATAVERALRERGFDVARVVRGGDLDAAIADAGAVVVLDAARRVAPADYEVALGAVALAVRDAPVKRVVTATQWPAQGRGHDLFAEVAKRAERGLAAVGAQLVRLRFGLLVGTPDAEGPFDDALFEREPGAWLPGDGRQCVRPLLIDDLAEVVAAAVTEDLGDELVVLAEGPEEVTLEALLEQLRATAGGISAGQRAADALRRMAWRLSSAVRQLPAHDLRLRDGEPPASVLGVTLRTVPATWTAAALEERPQRRQQARHRLSYRIPPWAGWVVGLLLILGFAVAAVGVHDLLLVPTLGGRLVSLGLVVVGVLGMIGGLGLTLTRWQPRYAIAFVASAVLLTAMVVMVLATWANGDVAWWWLIWVALGVVLFVACLQIWRLGNVEIADFMRTSVKVVGSILAAGVAVALVQFLYAAVYVPAAATPTINVDVALEPQATVGGMRAVDVVVKLRNESSYAVNVLGGNYRLDGANVEPAVARPPGRARRSAWLRALLAGGPVRGVVERVGKRQLDRGILLNAGVFLEPKEEIERRVVAHVPAGLDVLSLRAQLAVARQRFRGVSAYSFGVHRDRAGPVAVAVAQIDDPSLLQGMIRSTRYVHVVHALGRSVSVPCGLPGLVAYVDDAGDTDLDGPDCRQIDRQKANYYGLTYAEAGTELQLSRDRGGAAEVAAVKASAR